MVLTYSEKSDPPSSGPLIPRLGLELGRLLRYTIVALASLDTETSQLPDGYQAVDLGPEASFTKFPAHVAKGKYLFFLVRGKRGYSLLSNICPHSSGEVREQGSTFFCRDHGWRFEQTEGECINGPRARMISFTVTARDGHLFAELPPL